MEKFLKKVFSESCLTKWPIDVTSLIVPSFKNIHGGSLQREYENVVPIIMHTKEARFQIWTNTTIPKNFKNTLRHAKLEQEEGIGG